MLVKIVTHSTFVENGRSMIGNFFWLTELNEEEQKRLGELISPLQMSRESRKQLVRFGGHAFQVDYLISLDLRYVIVRHISYRDQPPVLLLEEYRHISLKVDSLYELEDLIREVERLLHRSPQLTAMFFGQKPLRKGKLINRTQLSRSNWGSLTGVVSRLESDLKFSTNLETLDLVFVYLMNRPQIENLVLTIKDVEKQLKVRLRNSLNDGEWQNGKHGYMFDGASLTLEELEERRKRGQRILSRFLRLFPCDLVYMGVMYNGGDHEPTTWAEHLHWFIRKLSDDEVLEFFWAYVGYTRSWDERSKIIGIAIEQRIGGLSIGF